MKKLLAMVLSTALVLSCMIIPIPVSAGSTDLEVPSTWTTIVDESFVKEPVYDADLDTEISKFPIGEYENDVFSSVTVNALDDASIYVDANGLNFNMPTAKRSANLIGELKTPLDFSGNADYYVSYDVYVNKSNSSGHSIRLGDSSNPLSTPRDIRVGVSSNNSPYLLTNSLYQASINGNYAYKTNYNKEYSYIHRTWQKVLIQISPRTDRYTLVRVRLFDLTDENAEAPTYSPSYWDNTFICETATNVGTTIDKVILSNSHNAGNGFINMIKNFKIYQASGINSYSTPTVKGDGTTAADLRYLPSDAVVSSANVDYTMTMDEITDENITLVEQGWYDYTDPSNPVLLSSEDSYVVPASMKGKLLKAKRVVIEDGVTTTYYPYVGYVKGMVSAYTPINSTLVNTNAFTAKLRYISGTSTKDYSKTNSATASQTYDKWVGTPENPTVLQITGQFIVNAYYNTNDGMISMVVAQYDEDGALKKVFTANPDNTTVVNRPYRMSEYIAGATQTHVANLRDENLDIESGDYFKAFLLLTTQTPAAVGSKYYYNYEQIIPMGYDPGLEREVADISGTLVTVPYPAE